jgi:hypothetical protein
MWRPHVRYALTACRLARIHTCWIGPFPPTVSLPVKDCRAHIHRVAISNNSFVALAQVMVTFRRNSREKREQRLCGLPQVAEGAVFPLVRLYGGA